MGNYYVININPYNYGCQKRQKKATAPRRVFHAGRRRARCGSEERGTTKDGVAPLRANGRGRVATAVTRETRLTTAGTANPEQAEEGNGERATPATVGGGSGHNRMEDGHGERGSNVRGENWRLEALNVGVTVVGKLSTNLVV